MLEAIHGIYGGLLYLLLLLVLSPIAGLGCVLEWIGKKIVEYALAVNSWLERTLL